MTEYQVYLHRLTDEDIEELTSEKPSSAAIVKIYDVAMSTKGGHNWPPYSLWWLKEPFT